MLVLERREGDRVIVPGVRLEIEVLSISATSVRIGFRAPQSVDIFRGEIWQRMAFESWDQDEPGVEEDIK